MASPRGEGGLLTGLRHGDLAHRYFRGILAWRDHHQSHVAPARDIHRASSPCPQTPQRQIALRGETNWTSPSKRLCPTPTWKGISRLDRQGNNRSGSNRQGNNLSGSKLPPDYPPEKNKKEGDQPSLPTIGRPPDYLYLPDRNPTCAQAEVSLLSGRRPLKVPSTG